MAIRWWKGKAETEVERRGWEEGSQMRLVGKGEAGRVFTFQLTIFFNSSDQTRVLVQVRRPELISPIPGDASSLGVRSPLTGCFDNYDPIPLSRI
nr:hypothetical protein Iba_chr12eCG15680 [Ipomoea batatas]